MSFHNDGIELSDEAQDDLAEIVAYGFAEWGELQSAQYLSDLLKAIERIDQYPFIDHGWTNANDLIRRLPFRSHIIIYRVNERGKAAEVVRILHGRMDVEHHLQLP